MLKNRRCIGEYSYREVVIPGGMAAIIDEELFERIQERLHKNKKAPAREKAKVNYLLTTKLFCGKCGAYMVGESRTGRNGKICCSHPCANSQKIPKKGLKTC